MSRITIIALSAAFALCGCATTKAPTPSLACNTTTGSRLPDGGACASPTRVYTQQDLQSTGRTTVAGALDYLDPALTVTHR
jgi:hypothetical protein